jgi:hypothetical protein
MDVILALGLLFTTASQFRVPGLPVGPGELCLVFWIVVRVFLVQLPGAPPPARAAMTLVAFWSAFAVALSLGMVAAMLTGEVFDPDLVLHDVVAYALVAVVGCLCAAYPSCLHRVGWLLVIAGAASLSLQYANGIGLIQVPGINPWFWERFRGWSDNPNQLSVLCLIIVLLAFYLAGTATGVATRLGAVALMIPPLIVGRMSKSDTFMLALAVAAAIWLVVVPMFWLYDSRLRLSLRASVARLALLAMPLLVLGLAPVVIQQAGDIKGYFMGFAKHGGAEAAGEADLRMTLWRQAIARGIASGMVGLGPGPHLQIPPSIVAGRVSVTDAPLQSGHPSQNGTSNYEAHNTVLDVFTQGGLLAVASLIWLLLRAATCSYRARSAGLIALLAGTATFMMTGNIVRQPIFWFAIILCLVAPVVPVPLRQPARAA